MELLGGVIDETFGGLLTDYWGAIDRTVGGY